ncbi:MAG TPA: MlaD family protein [Flavobacterium sp.]|nr:MlaD family protein [Flavobacterium sp.]
MNTNSPKFKVRLGLFVIVGLALFALAIFAIGKQKNLFDPVFQLSTRFNNVSGLQVGNIVRFSGINVGTVDAIKIVNDTTVQVNMLIKADVQKFIKVDSEAGIGSEGIIGDRILTISNGGVKSKTVSDGQLLASNEPVETDAIMQSLEITAGNAAIASADISEILNKVNSGNGTLGRLINDEQIAKNIDQTIVNLKSSTKGLNENMEAAKHNFLLRGYFKKKEKAAQKKKEEAAEKADNAKQEAAKKTEKKK